MKFLFISIIFSVLIALAPNVTLASDPTGLAQFAGCTGTDCSLCNVADMANGIITWLIGILFMVFALLLAIAGVRLVTSAGNHHALDEAKSSFTNAIIGMIIVLSAWLLVDTIMRALVGTSANPGQIPNGTKTGYLFWSEIECQEQTDYDFEGFNQQGVDMYDNGSPLSESGINTVPVGSSPIGMPPVAITGNLVTFDGRQFDSGIVSKVKYIKETFGLRVSGGYRTEERNREVGGAANSYHLTGRAADFVGSQTQMQAALRWARTSGAKEALIHDAGSGTHLHVAW